MSRKGKARREARRALPPASARDSPPESAEDKLERAAPKVVLATLLKTAAGRPLLEDGKVPSARDVQTAVKSLVALGYRPPKKAPKRPADSLGVDSTLLVPRPEGMNDPTWCALQMKLNPADGSPKSLTEIGLVACPNANFPMQAAWKTLNKKVAKDYIEAWRAAEVDQLGITRRWVLERLIACADATDPRVGRAERVVVSDGIVIETGKVDPQIVREHRGALSQLTAMLGFEKPRKIEVVISKGEDPGAAAALFLGELFERALGGGA